MKPNKKMFEKFKKKQVVFRPKTEKEILDFIQMYLLSTSPYKDEVIAFDKDLKTIITDKYVLYYNITENKIDIEYEYSFPEKIVCNIFDFVQKNNDNKFKLKRASIDIKIKKMNDGSEIVTINKLNNFVEENDLPKEIVKKYTENLPYMFGYNGKLKLCLEGEDECLEIKEGDKYTKQYFDNLVKEIKLCGARLHVLIKKYNKIVSVEKKTIYI